MTGKTTKKFSPEVRDRAVRIVLDDERDHPSRWAAVVSIAAKIGCAGQTLNEWVKKAERQRVGATAEIAVKLKALGRRKLEQHVAAMLDNESGASVSPRMRQLIDDMRAEWLKLDQRIASLDDEFATRARYDADAQRLATIPGIGVPNATALAAAVGDAQTFARGRDLAAWLGLVPRQITIGGKPRLVGITKRGNKYLRKPLIHGARSAMPALAAGSTPLGRWLRRLQTRVHKNAAVVALAYRLARIAWVVLREA